MDEYLICTLRQDKINNKLQLLWLAGQQGNIIML